MSSTNVGGSSGKPQIQNADAATSHPLRLGGGGEGGGGQDAPEPSSDMDDYSTGDVNETDDPSNPPPSKRQKLDGNDGQDDDSITQIVPKLKEGTNGGVADSKSKKGTIDPNLVTQAKHRLSKWAARLFDPDRPRGLVKPPQTIPLNDEFLAAFGKREKEMDAELGRILDRDERIDTDNDDDGDDDENDQKPNIHTVPAVATSKHVESGVKVKISNLAYRTSDLTLHRACEKFGPVLEVNLIQDKERQGVPGICNTGRAYVTFQTAESAEACVEGLGDLDGRTLWCSIALGKPNRQISGGDGTKNTTSLLTRYWERDISTKCFRCGGVGHIEANCINPAKPKPCPLCAIDDHDFRQCPKSRICFNCGVPGHVNRECQQPRGLPKRIVCGICFQSGHHRLQCRGRATDAPTKDAICMICGRIGHFMCQEMKWFYGLQGISCFNCGSQGHSGYECQRPTLFQCAQDPDLALKEIERAEAESV